MEDDRAGNEELLVARDNERYGKMWYMSVNKE